MVRPIVLMAEMEPPEGLSARKLVLETGKFNVITAYSVDEALDTLRAFPNVHSVVLHVSLCGGDGECDRVLAKVKKRRPGTLRVALSPTGGNCKQANQTLSSHEPQELLDLLRSRFGDPRMPQEKGARKRQA